MPVKCDCVCVYKNQSFSIPYLGQIGIAPAEGAASYNIFKHFVFLLSENDAPCVTQTLIRAGGEGLSVVFSERVRKNAISKK